MSSTTTLVPDMTVKTLKIDIHMGTFCVGLVVNGQDECWPLLHAESSVLRCSLLTFL